MNLLPFYDNDIMDSLISSEIYTYFDKNIFNEVDTSKISMDDLIGIFSNRELIDKCMKDLSLTIEDFFTYIIFYLKDEIDMRQLTRSKKKIQRLHDIINDISWTDNPALSKWVSKNSFWWYCFDKPDVYCGCH